MNIVGEPGHPEVIDAIERMRQAAAGAGIAAGMAGGIDSETNIASLKHGFQFLTLGNLYSLLNAATQEMGATQHL